MKATEAKVVRAVTVDQRPKSPLALIVLVSRLAGVVLFFAHAVFVPIALSILFALLLSAPVEALARKGFPRSVSAFLILLIFLGVLGVAVTLLWTPAQAWLQAAPRTAQIIQRKIGRYLALAALEGQVVQPLLVGQRLELVFLALWFAGWFWGIPGIVLAIPTLVALKVIAQHSPQGAPVVDFLSPSKSKPLKNLSLASAH